jgi:hypothetical protein
MSMAPDPGTVMTNPFRLGLTADVDEVDIGSSTEGLAACADALRKPPTPCKVRFKYFFNPQVKIP